MDRRNARGNRVGLAIVGLVLAVAGAAALARGLDLLPDLLGPAGAAVTDPDTREFANDNAWLWVALAVALIVVALLALAWLASQLRTGAVPTLRLEPDPRHGITTVPARVATGALEADLVDSPHFRRAQATVTGSPARPRLYLTATLNPTTDYGAAKRRLDTALNRHRQALAGPDTPTTVLLRSGR